MKIAKLALLASLIATPTFAQAPSDPLTAALKRQWDGVALNLREAAEKVPEDKYSFKPSPDVKSFAGEVGHGANTHYFFCARIKGEPNPNKEDYEKLTDKAALVKALVASNEYCSSLFTTANDKWLLETVGEGAQAQPRAAVLSAHIAHSNETYGTMVPYMRINGIVPPSTARAKK
jgi:hypothetical protein